MKRLVLVFCALIFVLECAGQVSAQKEIIYGTVQTDGYQKISQRAFWTKRPEAEQVYNGQKPEGVEVIVLDQEYFVRFAKGENNPLDINYIVFPRGAMVYVKNGIFYSAACGNKIDYIRPVNLVTVLEVEKIEVQQKTKQQGKVIDYGGGNVVNKSVIDLGNPIITEETIRVKTWFGRNWGWIAGIVGASALTTGGIYLYKNYPHSHYDSGEPGGAPVTPPVVPPPVIIPPVVIPPAGGPGGAPTTP